MIWQQCKGDNSAAVLSEYLTRTPQGGERRKHLLIVSSVWLWGTILHQTGNAEQVPNSVTVRYTALTEVWPQLYWITMRHNRLFQPLQPLCPVKDAWQDALYHLWAPSRWRPHLKRTDPLVSLCLWQEGRMFKGTPSPKGVKRRDTPHLHVLKESHRAVRKHAFHHILLSTDSMYTWWRFLNGICKFNFL